MNMFKTQGKVQTKATLQPTEPPKLDKLLQVQSSADLLKPHRHQIQLQRIKELAHVPNDIYERFYLPALTQVVELVQLLPAIRIAKFNKSGGLLDFTLRRTVETLAWYRRDNPILGQDPAKVPRANALMIYALFTAALLLGLGYISTQYWIALCEADGTFIKRYEPFQGSLLTQGQWYRMGIEPSFDKLANRATLLFAQMLVPNEAMAWLSTERDLFNAWLALLEGDLTDGSLLAQFVMPAEWQLLEQNLLTTTFDEIPSLLPLAEDISPFAEADIHPLTAQEQISTEAMPLAQQAALAGGFAIARAQDLSGDLGATEIGQMFVNWLRNGIEGHSKRTDGMRNQKLAVNTVDAAIHKAADGVHLNIKKLTETFNLENKLAKPVTPAQVADSLKTAGINFKNLAEGWVVTPDPTALMTKVPPDSRHVTVTQRTTYPEAAAQPATPQVTLKAK